MSKLPVVGIGASAGGLEAFKLFFEKVPTGSGLAFVLIPHLDPDHKSLMVEIISRHTGMPVIEADHRVTIEANSVYIVPPNKNLCLENNELVPSEISHESAINLPIDFFFRSLAVEKKELAIAVILSGTMRDGSSGIQDIKENGGLVIAQTPSSAQHDGMPQNAINTGIVDYVLAVSEMPAKIIHYISHPYVRGEHPLDTDSLNRVLTIVRARSRNDFRLYKRNTLLRRTERRMSLHHFDKMSDYVDFLKNDPQEVDALLKDMLIGVTAFFREEWVWDEVRKKILPELLSQLHDDIPLRVWIPACSTGEEAYTIAILAHDAFEKANRLFNAQIFATDIDGEAVETARTGIYPESSIAPIPAEFVEKYFHREDHGYRIKNHIRESVVFAEQNLIGDAPFSNMDLISCRNLLIYLNPNTQKKITELFHFSLKPEKYLILGNSETIGHQNKLFTTISKDLRIYKSIGRQDEKFNLPVVGQRYFVKRPAREARVTVARRSISDFMQSQLLKQYAPAAILIDNNFEIHNLYGPTGQYLDLPQGEPVMELTSMIKEGLRLKIRAAVRKAGKRSEPVTVTDARVKREHKYYPVTFTVTPVNEELTPDKLYLITFEDRTAPQTKPPSSQDLDLGEESLVHQLEAELAETREDLQNTIEELESSNEELKASNEEMMSMNEELQSSNEELETSKEELQSMNEELNTVNAELRDKVGQLEIANNDIANLMNSTEVATVFLDTDMRIRRFTPTAKQLFKLIDTDIGRPIGDLAMRFSDDELKSHAAEVLEKFIPSSREVYTDDCRWYIRRILPFRTHDSRVDGLVLTFTDVTDLKNSEIDLKKSKARLSAAVAISGVGIYEHCIPIGPELYHSKGWAKMLGYSVEELPPYKRFLDWLKMQVHPDDQRVLENTYTDFINGETEQYEVEVRMRKKSGEWIHVQGLSRALARDEKGEVTQVIGVTLDVTKFRQIEAAVLENEQRYRSIFNIGLFGIAITSNEKEWIQVNDAACHIFGYSRDELDGMDWVEISYPDDLASDLDQFNRILCGEIDGYSMDKRFIRKNGRIVYTKIYVNAVRKADGSLLYCVKLIDDISEKKEKEMRLQQSERRLRQAQEMAHLGHWDWYLQGNRLLWSDEVYKIFGRNPSQFHLTTAAFEETIHPDDYPGFVDEREKALQEARNINIEHRILLPDGKERYVHEIAEALRDDDGNVTQVSGTVQDITEQKRAALGLKKTLTCLPRRKALPILAAGNGRYRRMLFTGQKDFLQYSRETRHWERQAGRNTHISLYPKIFHGFKRLLKSAASTELPMR